MALDPKFEGFGFATRAVHAGNDIDKDSGAINIPIEHIKQLYQLPKDKNICLFCQAGEISGEFAELLSDNGYNAYNLTGGYREYLRYSLAKDKSKDNQ